MVDLLTLQTLGVIIAAVSVVIGVAYNLMQISEQKRSRQAQLFMSVYNHYLDKIVDDEMTVYSMNYKDYDDFMEKYGWERNPEFFNKFNKFVSYLEGVGVLVKRELIDPSMVYDLNGGFVKWYWEKSKPYWVEFRVRNNEPHATPYTEYLYERLMPIGREKYSESKNLRP